MHCCSYGGLPGSVLSYVDLGGLREVELLVGGLFHKVEKGIFEHELHQVREGLFGEQVLTGKVAIFDRSYCLELTLVV